MSYTDNNRDILRAGIISTNFSTLQNLLDGLNIQSVVFDSFSSALDTHADNPLDMFILDYYYKDKSVYSFCQDARKVAGGQDLYLFSLAALEQYGDFSNVIEAGINDACLKPVNTNRLRMRLILSLDRIRTIRKRRQAESNLHSRTQELQDYMEAAEELIHTMSADGRLTYANPRWLTKLGYTKNEVLGRSILDFVSPRFEAHCRKLLFDPEDGIRQQATQSVFLDRNGQEVFIKGTLIRRSKRNGPGSLMCIARDVTTEQEVKKQIDLQLAALKAAANGIVISDRNGVIRWVNPAFSQLTGYSFEEAVGRNPKILKSGHHNPDFYIDMWKTILDGRVWRGLIRNRHKDGYVYIEDMTITPVRDVDGTISHFVAVKQDTTERFKAEQELKQQWDRLDELVRERTQELDTTNDLLRRDIEERRRVEKELARFATAIDQLAEMIVMTDSKGRIEYVNAAFEQITGYQENEVIGNKFSLLKSGRHDNAFYQNLWQTISRGNVWSGHIINRRKDGTLYEEEQTISPIRDEVGRLVSYLAVKRDVTQVMQLEKQLSQAQKLESIGRLAAGIAHEVNTPTQYVGDNTSFVHSAIIDLVRLFKPLKQLVENTKNNRDTRSDFQTLNQLLSEIDLDFLETEIPLALKQSLDGLDRVSEIVRAMKEFSHPGSEKKTEVDLNQAIASTITVCRNEWKYVATIETDFARNLPRVPCLVGPLNQVFLNLIVNAAHTISDVVENGKKGRGIIRIRTSEQNGGIEVHISDTGTGIPEDIRDKIFDPFFTTKEVGKGSGQGLAISHNVIVEKHGGSIQVESEIGSGTTFIIWLPISKTYTENLHEGMRP